MSQVKHNLDIKNYNFQELLALFDLDVNMTLADLKRAKRKVLYLHPDKSKLAPHYFLFYKKAFEIIVSFYEERTKQDRELPQEPIKYTPMVDRKENPNTQKMAEVIRQYQSGDEKQRGFQKQFNEFFEENMAQRPDPNRNQWFREETPIYTHPKATNENLGQVIQNVKSQAATMVKYRGVENLYLGGGGTNFYDDMEADEDTSGGYISSDLFSNLKFDDLRKVHKDQTVFVVSEMDYDPSKRAHNMDHLSRERNTQDLTPLEKSYAENLIAEQQREYEKRMFHKQHQARLRTMEYEKKNDAIMAKFLQLTNR